MSVDGNSDEVMEFLTIHEYHSKMDGTPSSYLRYPSFRTEFQFKLSLLVVYILFTNPSRKMPGR